MSKVTLKVDLSYEQLRKAVSELSNDEKEALFFEFSPALGKALQKMKKETIQEDNEGKTVSLENI